MNTPTHIYGISYRTPPHPKAPRPWPQFEFYVEASSESQALAKFSLYSEKNNIEYHSLAVSWPICPGELLGHIEPQDFQVGIALQRPFSQANAQKNQARKPGQKTRPEQQGQPGQIG